jgi:uncharacterized protein (TIGR04255 family)
MMAEPLPKFDAPPLVETLLSVQFEQLPNFTSAFAGWFWKAYLTDLPGPWLKTADAPRIPDQFERFGQDTWQMATIQLGIGQRAQFIRADEERMIQVQDSRVVLNWKKNPTGTYPSYGVLLPEFKSLLELFCRFVRDAGFGELKLNLWEMVYVNSIPKGELWRTQNDMDQVFSDIHMPRIPGYLASGEFLNATWRYALPDQRGRLYLTLLNAQTPLDTVDGLRLQLLARGAINPNDCELDKYFDLGHETIVRTFGAITTPQAHKFWRRTQ